MRMCMKDNGCGVKALVLSDAEGEAPCGVY